MNEQTFPRVIIVAENASAKFGGEAILPIHYFRRLRERGVEAWLIVNHRAKWDLEKVLPEHMDRILFVPDTKFHRLLEHMAKPFPGAIRYFTFRYVGRLVNQFRARKMARQMVAEKGVQIVHQPTPVSPKESSLLYNVGVPVVIGPLNGGMSYPPGFKRAQQNRLLAALVGIGRFGAQLFNRLMPGKLRASVVLVANDRTASALPRGVRGRVVNLVENGVDLSIWRSASNDESPTVDRPIHFAFSGRLVDWKAVDILLDAFAIVVRELPATLDIIGGGVMRETLEAQAKTLGIERSVRFHGWVTQPQCAEKFREADVFVLPSLFECGGAVVLEAMACGLPVIATRWGGPADYLDESCGVLIEPNSREQMVRDLASAMLALARDPQKRRQLGAAGREKVEREYDWARKIDRILEIYGEAIAGYAR